MGGVIAFEMARQLRAAGEEVELLALVDSYVPGVQLPPGEAQAKDPTAACASPSPGAWPRPSP